MSELPLPEQFRGFADSAAHDGATTYATICRAVAGDADVLSLLSEAPLSQRRPNLLLAAVHFLLLGGVEHPLAGYYDTVMSYLADSPTSIPAAPTGDVAGEFRSFCLDHRDAVLALVTSRSTQTNEVGRCTALLPALATFARAHPQGQPMSLLDLGTSAGLNLLIDRYAYTYRSRDDIDHHDSPVLRAGDPSSPVDLHCTVRGPLADLPPLGMPRLADRVGIDLSPIDPRTEEGARWLLACLWPDHLPRFEHLHRALDVARSTTDPPTLHRGDIVDDLAPIAATIDPDVPLVVLHTWVAAYLDATRQHQLVDAVRSLARTRPVHYLYAESPFETPGLPTPSPPVLSRHDEHRTALVHLDLTGGHAAAPAPVRLADMHPHGRWLRWWGTPSVRP